MFAMGAKVSILLEKVAFKCFMLLSRGHNADKQNKPGSQQTKTGNEFKSGLFHCYFIPSVLFINQTPKH